jgi:hypothetical protein
MATPLKTVTEFRDRFAGEIRVAFNWHRFESERWPVERVELRYSREGALVLESPGTTPIVQHRCVSVLSLNDADGK